MRMFTKIGVTVASGALPVLLWAGAANAQQSSETTQSQSQSQSTLGTTPTTISSNIGGTNTGGLARTGAEDLLPLAVGGVAIAGAVAVRSFRRRSVV